MENIIYLNAGKYIYIYIICFHGKKHEEIGIVIGN